MVAGGEGLSFVQSAQRPPRGRCLCLAALCTDRPSVRGGKHKARAPCVRHWQNVAHGKVQEGGRRERGADEVAAAAASPAVAAGGGGDAGGGSGREGEIRRPRHLALWRRTVAE